jgi:hypothetical protein
MTMTGALSDAQVLLLSALLLVACAAKALRALRARSIAGLGPTVMFPLRLRGPAAIGMCVTEFGLAAGLLVTAGTLAPAWVRPAAAVLRLGTVLLFLTTTSALIELRARRPDVGCGCFGDLSTAPVSLRTVTRCALLTAAAAGSVRAPAMSLTGAAFVRNLRAVPPAAFAVFAAELIVMAALSPEVGEMLVRLGYRAPCEVRRVPVERTLSALRASRAWRRHTPILTSGEPVDIWRELCWRYAVFPGWHEGREADVVFAVHLSGWRPVVLAAVTDASTGEVLRAGLAAPAAPDGSTYPAPAVPSAV